MARDLQHHHHNHHNNHHNNNHHHHEQDNDQPLDMSKPNRGAAADLARERRDGPPGDTGHLFSGLHLLVDAAMGVLEARRSSSSRVGGAQQQAPVK